MSDSSERLRRMTEYSWHVLRADSERERAYWADDEVARQLHDELADLHQRAADDLSIAWRTFHLPEDPARAAASPLDELRPLLAGLFGVELGADPVQLLMPPLLLLESPQG